MMFFLSRVILAALALGASIAAAQVPDQKQSDLQEPETKPNPELTSTEAASIAREAYGYGLPIIENYRNMYAEAIDNASDQYRHRSMC